MTLTKRYVFAPVEACFAYTLEQTPYRDVIKATLDHICNYMSSGLVDAIKYETQYEEGNIHRVHITFQVTFKSEQNEYELGIFYRRLGMFEWRVLSGAWRLYDMDEPEEVECLSEIARKPCFSVFLDNGLRIHA